MCGIAGIFNYRSHAPVDGTVVRAMTDAIAHRGPDGNDSYVHEDIGLGFTRLSIIDLQNGVQPMRSSDGRYSLVFNGEIYNYKVVRAELSERGYQFRTYSDTEVILALFEMGDRLPEEKLRGMFAFALYDGHEKRLILSRDRLGKKPLYWSKTRDGVIFGSEIKSLLCAPDVVRAPNWPVISDFLTLSYCPGMESAFEGILQVPPGGRLMIKDNIEERIWWSLPSKPESKKNSADDWEAQVLAALRESVKYRLIADARLGIFLSGGMDSALILSLISEEGFPDNFTAYTAGFDSSTFDETREAKMLADRFGIKHVSVPVKPQDVERIFEDVVFKSDNLIANPAIFANYLLSEAAHGEVKAVLHGGGGDELFFGYETYRADEISKTVAKIPTALLRLLEAALKPLPASHNKLGFKYRATKFMEGMHYSLPKRHYWWRTILTEHDKDQLLDKALPRHDSYQAYERAYARFSGDDFFEQAAYADMQVWWQCMGLYQGDAMSMANSLELRMPFMDHKLIELMANIPREVKFKDRQLKILMKRVCQNYLPPEILKRPKSGFHVPMAEWFTGPLKNFLAERLSPERIGAVPGLNIIAVRKIIDQHHARQFDNSFKLINLMVLVEWYRRFLL